MSLLLKYFWLLSVPVGVINMFTVKKRLDAENNQEDYADKNKALCCFLLLNTLPFLFLQVFQLAGNYKTGFYIFFMDFDNIFYVGALIVLLLAWLTVLVIILMKPKAVEKYGKFMFRYKLTQKQLLLIALGFPVFICIILFYGSRNMNIRQYFN